MKTKTCRKDSFGMERQRKGCFQNIWDPSSWFWGGLQEKKDPRGKKAIPDKGVLMWIEMGDVLVVS